MADVICLNGSGAAPLAMMAAICDVTTIQCRSAGP